MPSCHICGKSDLAMLCVCGACAEEARALQKELAGLAIESIERDKVLAKLECEVLAALEAHTAQPLDDWNEDIGDVLWWRFPADEPPYCGSPLDVAWPGYHTHWTPIIMPKPPEGGEG